MARAWVTEKAKGAKDAFKDALGMGPSPDTYKMLLIGETGSGKTSFLNFLCNSGFVLADPESKGVLDKIRKFNDIKLENPKSGDMESKTSDAKLYPNVKLAGGLTVGIIDTPGFGDSRGMEQDEQNAKKIVAVLKSVDFINCICLVINGSVARMTATLKYVLTEVTAILPREILNNVIVVLTNIADPLDRNFNPAELAKFLGKEVDSKRVFLINNPYCRVEKAKKQQAMLDRSVIEASLIKSFGEARGMLTSMCNTIKEFQQVHTHHFITLYKTKQKVEREVQGLLLKYDYQTSLEQQLSTVEEEAKAALTKKKLNADYRTTCTVLKWVQKSTTKHNTLCGAKQCYSNCHIKCSLPRAMDKAVIKRCASFNGGSTDTCTDCGHDYRLHYHDEVLHEKMVENVETIDSEARSRFINAKTQEERAQVLKQELSRKKVKSEKERKALSVQLLLTIEEFQRLGVARNYALLLQNQLFVVEHRLKGEDIEHREDLQKTKEEIKKKLDVVQKTLKQPWSRDAEPTAKKTWACGMLGVEISATIAEVERAYKEKLRICHPDKAGDDESFKRLQRAKEILLGTA